MGLADLPDEGNEPNEHSEDFREFVKNWDGWPEPLRAQQRQQLENVADVLWRMKESEKVVTLETYKRARTARSKEVRNSRPWVGTAYFKTVHKNCVNNLGFKKVKGYTDPQYAFLMEARKLIQAWREKEA